jgi:hypothetical protein
MNAVPGRFLPRMMRAIQSAVVAAGSSDEVASAAHLIEDEFERLAALHRRALLDTPADPAFDRITRLAADLSRAPVALVSFIDTDRQWFRIRASASTSPQPSGLTPQRACSPP